MARLIGSTPASASFRTCMYSAENACLVIALGAALAFPPGFLLSALGVRTWCSIYGEAAAHTQCIRAASRGSVWAMPHFHCTLNTVRFVLNVHGVVHKHKSAVVCVRTLHALSVGHVGSRDQCMCMVPQGPCGYGMFLSTRPPFFGV